MGSPARLLICALALGACTAPQRLPEPAPGDDLPLCREAWARLPPGAADYDFHRDAQPSAQGNLGYQAYAARVDRPRCRKPWTVLLYMAADNDLMPYAALNLYEMEAAGPADATASTVDSDVVVRLDPPGAVGLRRLHIFAADVPYDSQRTLARFAGRGPADLRSPVVALDPEPAVFDQAEDLREFLRWGVTHYPAQHYLVVVWGHGEGFAGVAFNDTRRTHLEVPALHDVLRQVVDGPLGGRPIDVYLADACLMQTLEVTTELADVARFLVGSIQVQDYLGMSYRDLLQRLNAAPHSHPACRGQPDEEACAVAALLPEIYQTSMRKGLRATLAGAAAGPFTLSAVRSAALQRALLPALAALARALSAYLAENRTHPGSVQALLADRDSPSFLGNERDVGVFLRLLAALVQREARRHGGQPTPAGAALLPALSALQAALQEAEISRSFGSDYQAVPDFLAYSLWLPPVAEDYAGRLPVFAPSRFFHNGQAAGEAQGPWPRWLSQVYGNAH